MHAYPAGGSTGDDAFAALCEQHRARLVAFCTRRLGTRHDAEDAAHEALLRAYRAWAAFDGSADAWPWLRTIARHVCTDMQRKAARVVPTSAVEKPAAFDVHEQMAARVRAEIVEDALDRLSPRYRSPLLLRELGGWSYDDIARVQGRSRASVRSILTRSRRRLGGHVEEVARSQRQWPLPAALQPLRRLRGGLRSVCDGFERSGPAAAALLDASATAAGRLLFAANTTLASMLGASTTPAVTTTPAPTPRPEIVVPAVLPGPANLGLEQGVRVTVADRAQANIALPTTTTPPDVKTLSRQDVTAPDGSTAMVKFSGGEESHHVWVEYWIETPTGIPLGFRGNFPCQETPVDTVLCRVLPDVLPLVPQL